MQKLQNSASKGSALSAVSISNGLLKPNPMVGHHPNCKPKTKEQIFASELEKGMLMAVRNGKRPLQRIVKPSSRFRMKPSKRTCTMV